MQKLIAGVMGQDCMKFLPMCLESLKDADRLVYIDGGSKDNSVEFAKSKGCEIIINEYKQEDIGMNGKQRNKFLSYIKEKYPNEWCIFCDADEIVEDFGIQKLKNINLDKNFIISPVIHHLLDLGHEDATRNIHFVPNRFFKITDNLIYDEVEHPVLRLKEPEDIITGSIDLHIYHLRECLGIFETRKKHLNNWKKSNMHSIDYLNWWNNSMLLGNYPTKPIYYGQLPTPIKQYFYLFRDV